MATTSSEDATIPSSHQWLAVSTTTSAVTTGWAMISQRQRLGLILITTIAMRTAQPTCTEGIADSWSAIPLPKAP